MGQNIKYIRVSEPDKDELARLLTKAKGDKRTMGQFAQECGASPSTFSRIVNKEIRKTSSDELIKAIAEHADPDSKVTLDALMAAHGMARMVDESTVVKISPSDLEKKFNDAILYQLGEEGSLISYSFDKKLKIGTTFSYQPDLLVRSKSVDAGGSLWAFELVPLPAYDSRELFHSTRGYAKHILDTVGRILPLFYNKNRETLGKFSFVIIDKKVFDYLVSEFAEYYVPFNMSFILFDCGKERIEQEIILKKTDK